MAESPWSLLFKFINFAVMLGILVKFAAKPFKDFLRNRQAAIKEKVDEADRMLKEAGSLKGTYQEKLAQLDREIETFRTWAREEAEKEKAKILAEAHAMAGRIREQAQLAYDQELEDAMATVRAEIARRTMGAAEQTIRQIFKEEDHNKMVDEFIEKLRGRN